jgi:hypothetical protein
MFGVASPCVFMVFSNAGAGGDEALARWYMEVHGPEALAGGTFSALHRYLGLGRYDARFLAVWEGSWATLAEARKAMTPAGGGRPNRSRITDDLLVVWSALKFLTGPPPPAAHGPVRTLTLVEGGRAGQRGTSTYLYGDVELDESAEDPDTVADRWRHFGREGIAPHGPYRTIFEDPDGWPPEGEVAHETWVSHWRPLASLRREEA